MDVRFAELMEAVHSTRHARFPVIGQSLDDVRGVSSICAMLAEPIARGESAWTRAHALGALSDSGGDGVLETSNLG